MKRHGVEAIEDAFGRIDALLDERLRIVVIGGAAIAMITRDATLATKDVDTYDLVPDDADRLAAAGEVVGIEIGPTGVAELPYDFEDRIVRGVSARTSRSRAQQGASLARGRQTPDPTPSRASAARSDNARRPVSH